MAIAMRSQHEEIPASGDTSVTRYQRDEMYRASEM
jgi:hypothetical protein